MPPAFTSTDQEHQPSFKNAFPPRKGSGVSQRDYQWLVNIYNNTNGTHAALESSVPHRDVLLSLATTGRPSQAQAPSSDDDERAIRAIKRLLIAPYGQQSFKTIGVSVATAITVAEVDDRAKSLKWYCEPGGKDGHCPRKAPICRCLMNESAYSKWLRNHLCRIRRAHLKQTHSQKYSMEWIYRPMRASQFLRLPLELREQVRLLNLSHSLSYHPQGLALLRTYAEYSWTKIYGYLIPPRELTACIYTFRRYYYTTQLIALWQWA